MYISVSPNGSVSVDPILRIVDNGSDTTFTCSARGGPSNTFAWIRTFDESKLLSQRPVNVSAVLNVLSPIATGDTISLSYINATQNGGGYICVAINEAGTGSSSTSNLYVHPTITTQPMNQYVRRGDNVTLTCIADSFPAPAYQWEFFNTTLGRFIPLPADVRDTNSVLAIGDVQYQDFGTFRCNVTTQIINETITSNEAVVTSKKLYTLCNYFYTVCIVSPEDSSNISPQYATVDNGSDTTFTCSAKGGPNNTFAWIRSAGVLSDNQFQTLTSQRPVNVSAVLSVLSPIATGDTLSLSYINATQDGG